MKKYSLKEAIDLYEEDRYEEAMQAFKQHKKEMEAQYYIGLLYFEGFGTKKSLEEAKYWFKKSARQGNLDAEYMLLCCEGNTTACCKG